MIHGTGLSNGSEVDAGVSREVRTELALFSLVKPRVILKIRFVLLAIGFAVEGQDRDGGHLAIAVGNAEVPGNILTGAIGALVDAATSTAFRRGIGIERALTVDAFADHGNLVGWCVEQLQDIISHVHFALRKIICDLRRLIGGIPMGNPPTELFRIFWDGI